MEAIVVQTPSHVLAAEAVIVASRSGATGILDITYRRRDLSSIEVCHEYCTPHRWGLRVSAVEDLQRIHQSLGIRIPAVVIGESGTVTADQLAAMRAFADELVVEVGSIDNALRMLAIGADGVVLRGDDTGGSSSTFILLQHARASLGDAKWWLSGSIGKRAANAALHLGAHGIVLSGEIAHCREIAVLNSHPPDAASIASLVGDYREAIMERDATHLIYEGAPLALAHGTRFPIVQGPMTRVSDVPEFLDAVGNGGALPCLALALARGSRARDLLEAAAQTMRGRPWAVGLLGFLPAAVREEQIALVASVRPPFAVIAGGTAQHARRFDELGITTYLHAPSAPLFEILLKAGVRHFVLEGNECGGHVGPRSSFGLWEAVVDRLLEHPDLIAGISLLAAGGIHDSVSATAVSRIFAPVAASGAKIGVLMGSAYLFTEESVSTGAIVPDYHRRVLEAAGTVLLESAPGYRTRCLPTPFAETFQAKRAELLASGLSVPEIAQQLELVNVGRLRIAAKGVVREAEGELGLRGASPLERDADGLYMIGEAATLRREPTSIAELHASVCTAVKSDRNQKPRDTVLPPKRDRSRDIAIIGMECILPGASDITMYWYNIVRKAIAIREVSPDRWNVANHFSSDRLERDKTYAKWGGFLDPVRFDPLTHGIPPASLASISSNQLLALEVARRVLTAGGFMERADLRARTAVIFGSADSGEKGGEYSFRALLPAYLATLDEFTSDERDELYRRFVGHLPDWTEDSLPGILQNVVSGRIANRLDLGGANFTVDAACATSFAALETALHMLRSGACDAALVGAVDTSNSALSYTAFSRTQALSPDGKCRPFDRAANGIVLSEGVAAILLQPLDSAEEAGSRILAVIKGVGSASDGRHRTLTVPYVEGQVRAMEAAYRDAGVDPSTVELLEAHGTGTEVGDEVELAGLERVFGGALPGTIALGSVKSMIGHTKTVAGLAGMIKAACALDQRVLPPTIGIEHPHLRLRSPSCPFTPRTEPAPWIPLSSSPRRAGVSAFGFGGTNYHVVLEEHRERWRVSRSVNDFPRSTELVFFSASKRQNLIESLRHAIRDCRRESSISVRELSRRISEKYASGDSDSIRLAVTVDREDVLESRLDEALAAVYGGKTTSENGIYFRTDDISVPRISFLYPGQGAHYPWMFEEIVMAFPELIAGFETADAVLAERLEQPLSSYIFPRNAWNRKQDTAKGSAFREAISRSDVAQPALLISQLVITDLLASFGITPDAFAGHSFGEYSAIAASGAIDRDEILRGAHARGRVCCQFAAAQPGGLMVVSKDVEAVRELIGKSGEQLYVAGINAPRQTLVGGTEAALVRFARFCRASTVPILRLPVPVPYHTPLMQGSANELRELLRVADWKHPGVPVVSNVTADYYPDDSQGITDLLVRHLHEPISFTNVLETLYRDGTRVFVEIGPGTSATRLVEQMAFPDSRALAVNQRGDTLSSLAHLLGELYSLGRVPDWRKWFVGRSERAAGTLESPYVVDGARARRRGEPIEGVSRRSLPLSRIKRDLVLYKELGPRFLAPLRVMPSFGNGKTPVIAFEAEPKNTSESELSFRDALLETVARCTGYPISMLTLDGDLQSELGVDSIKRVEIASHLMTFDSRLGGGNQELALEQLVQLRTLRDIIEWYESGTSEASPVRRYRVFTEPAELPQSETPRDLDRIFPENSIAVVFGADDKSVEAICSAFERRGISAVVGDMKTTDEKQAEELFAGIARSGKQIGAMAYCGGGSPKGDLDHGEHFFLLVQALLRRTHGTRENALRWIGCVTTLGGDFGLGGGRLTADNVSDAGLFGVAKVVAREFPEYRIRCIDCELGLDSAGVADKVIEEFALPDAFIEVGLTSTGRCTIRWQEEEAPPAATINRPASEGTVLLITGGLSGITAEVTEAIARDRTAHIVVVGRSALDQMVPPELDELPTDALREHLVRHRERYALAHAGAIEAYIKALSRHRERIFNRDRIRAAAASFDYKPLDTGDPGAMAELVREIHRTKKRITGVIHGAGVVEDMLVRKKSLESFQRVYRTKVRPLSVFLEELDPGALEFFVLFSSVAARFGSVGQVDYAAANEVLNKWACLLRTRWKNTNVVSLNWGPWDGGMVSPALAEHYRANGIDLISLEQGRNMFLEEVNRPPSSHSPEVVISGSIAAIAAWNVRSFTAPSPIPDAIQEKAA